jgi:Virulence factor membrane-bound polymerase, C-terminal/O-Antigen ligase/Protein glycosylation ligase
MATSPSTSETSMFSPSAGEFMFVATLAIAAPTLLAHNVAPSSTFLNQALSFGLWGGLLMLAGLVPQSARPQHLWRPAAPLLLALAILAAAALVSWQWGSLPTSLALSALGTLFAAVVVALAGVSAARGPGATMHFGAYCWGWWVAGLCGVLIAAVQVFAPGLPDGSWIAHSGIVGRAVGNLRQPNHLSSVLLWAAVAAVALLELRRLRLAWSVGAMALLVFAVVLTASRTGLLSVLLLAVWGLLDRRLQRSTRALLLATPLMYLLAWLGMSAWGQVAQHAFGGAARLAETDISGSRFGIWANTLSLIAAQPWFGVGFGEFNFAWSLTPFPQRPVAFFDHAHNLPLQLAAELGLPLAAVVMALLLWALWRVGQAALKADGERGITLRCAGVMVLMIGLHSLLEYPLWYAYFLLPAAWVFGHALGLADGVADEATAAPRLLPNGLTIAGAMLLAGAVFSVYDYSRVTAIFSAAEGAPPLAQRIAAGQRSVFFAHHADYAAATVDSTEKSLAPFRGAAHYLLDTRLMTAWAEALYVAGQDDAARHVAQRLREFRNPLSKEFFEACDVAASAAAAFQCHAPQSSLSWRALAKD